jgi:hypothetical protein
MLAVSDRADRQLLLVWRTNLAHQYKVKRSPQGPSNLEANGHTATRQCQYDRMLILETQQPLGQEAACLSPIKKHGDSPP